MPMKNGYATSPRTMRKVGIRIAYARAGWLLKRDRRARGTERAGAVARRGSR